MRTVIVENVETAEAKKQRLATTAVDAALEILRTEASGLVIEAAAPLVFQGLCRRDNIRVEFTQTPMTNGRVIWLGPIDLGHKLASIYVYGHGCHERHHVMYTNFAAMRGIGDPGVRDLANVFEDIRVDKLGAADYAGYLLWRLVLFKAHEATGTAGWSNPNDLEPAHLFAMMLLTTLEFEVLGIDMFEEISANLRGECDRLFGPRPMARVLKIVRAAFPLDSTEAAVELAHKVMRCIRAEKNKALKAVEEAAGKGSTDNFEFRQGEGQSLLFDDDGAVTPEGDPRLMHPELEAINRNARCLSVISDQRQWPDREPEEESFRKLIGNGESGNGDPNFASPERHFANDREYPTLQPEKAAMNRRRRSPAAHPSEGSFRARSSTRSRTPTGSTNVERSSTEMRLRSPPRVKRRSSAASSCVRVAKRSSRSFSTLRVPWKARRSRLPRSPASASLRRSVR